MRALQRSTTIVLSWLLAAGLASAREAVEAASGDVVVLAAPRDDAGSLGTAHRGETYVQVHCGTEWRQFWFGVTTGWARARSLSEVRATTRTISASSANVRSGPGASYAILGTAPRGSSWAIEGSDGDWRRVSYAGRTGWIHQQALSADAGTEAFDGPWQEDRIAEGVTWRSRAFPDLYGGRQVVNVLVIDPMAARVAPVAVRQATPTSRIAREAGAIAGVNGVFYMPTSPVRYLDYLMIRGVVVAEAPNRMRPILGATIDGRMAMAGGADAEAWRGVRNAIGGHPWLVQRGRVVAPDGNPADDYIYGRNPRTAAGLTSRGTLMLVTIDGRATQSIGVTFPQLGRFMRSLGCVDAMNLDGGGSTTMWIRGRGVVNYPSDDGVWGHAGERSVASSLAVFSCGR